MLHPRVARFLVLFALLLLPNASGSSHIRNQVDVALVLAVDVSYSMDQEEVELQRRGYVEAFRSSMAHRAIYDGVLGQIAVVYFEWSGPSGQWVIIPWTLIGAPEDAMAFAGRLESMPISRTLGGTSISGAVDFSLQLLADSPFTAIRQVIDISGDGINSHGRPVAQARDEAVLRGVTINGLSIRLKDSSALPGAESVDEHYRNCVVGGQGAFTVPVRNLQEMAEAIRSKIIREIAALPVQSLIQHARTETRQDCQPARFKHNPRR